jgi:hypothetical protein
MSQEFSLELKVENMTYCAVDSSVQSCFVQIMAFHTYGVQFCSHSFFYKSIYF